MLLRELGAGGGSNVGFDMLTGTIGIYQLESHRSLLPEIGEMTPFGGRENLFHYFLRNAACYLTIRKPSIV